MASYFFEPQRAGGEAALAAAAEALLYFSEIFGPYPHAGLTLVEAGLADGLEYDGFFFLDEGLYRVYWGNPAGYLTAITVHETAHQWWYGLVGSNQPLEPWLDEAPATYSELLFYEATYPDLVNWWWVTRVHRYESFEPVDSTIYSPFDFQFYVNTVYLRGALFLDQVRMRMGHEPFLEFYRAYLAEASGGQATADLFFDLLAERLDPAELEALRQIYFADPGR